MYKVSLDRDLLLYSSMHYFFCSLSICLSALFPRSMFSDFLFIVQMKKMLHTYFLCLSSPSPSWPAVAVVVAVGNVVVVAAAAVVVVVFKVMLNE